MIPTVSTLLLVLTLILTACGGSRAASGTPTPVPVMGTPVGAAASLIQNLIRGDAAGALALYPSPEQTPERRAQIENLAAGFAGCLGTRIDFAEQRGAATVSFNPPCGDKARAFPGQGSGGISRCRVEVEDAGGGQLRPKTISC